MIQMMRVDLRLIEIDKDQGKNPNSASGRVDDAQLTMIKIEDKTLIWHWLGLTMSNWQDWIDNDKYWGKNPNSTSIRIDDVQLTRQNDW